MSIPLGPFGDEVFVDTTEVKKKLASGGVMPGHIDEFCRVLALRLPKEVSPLGFLMAFELLISDMEKAPGRTVKSYGNSGEEEISTYIAGLPIGNVVRLLQTKIVKHAFPEDFANQVKVEMDGVIADMKAMGAL